MNNFSGSLEVCGGFADNGDSGRGLTGSLLLPVSGGSGLTRQLLVVTDELRIGNSMEFGTIVVTNGGAFATGG